jgi:hypothetical protein
MSFQEYKKVKLPLSLTNSALRHEDVWGSGCIDPDILGLGTSWRWVVSFTPPEASPRWKSPRYQLDRRLSEPKNRSGWSAEEKNLPLPGLELRTLSRPASSQSLYRLRYPGSEVWRILNKNTFLDLHVTLNFVSVGLVHKFLRVLS